MRPESVCARPAEPEPPAYLPVILMMGGGCGTCDGWRHVMRKMILMALAGYLWRKLRSRAVKRAFTGKTVHRPRF